MKYVFGKKGMEMWQLILLILALVFLVLMLFFYKELGAELKDLFGKIGRLW
jgi:hypothetical protein